MIAKLPLLISLAVITSACSDGTAPGSVDAAAPIAFTVRAPHPDSMPLYLVQPDGSNLRRILDGAGTRYGVTWAPDRNRLAYVFSRSGKVNESELRIVNADGTGDHAILGPGTYSNPAWAPGGSRILFTEQVAGGMLQLETVAPDGSGRAPLGTRVADDQDPAWAPDGRSVAFVSNCRGEPPCDPAVADLWVMNADGSNPRQLTFGTGIDDDAGAPTWSPDGKWIAFQMHRDQATNIYRIRPTGDSLQQLTSGDASVSRLWPSYSPDGSALLFTRWEGYDSVNTPLFIASPDGSDPRPLGLTVGEPVGATWAR
ncbi:MAG TPA: hypothetical protein VFL95_11055 [Gemmatimonadales bacterium]|nr:hypothetical protein [Gemmatimonadales bacterium]